MTSGIQPRWPRGLLLISTDNTPRTTHPYLEIVVCKLEYDKFTDMAWKESFSSHLFCEDR